MHPNVLQIAIHVLSFLYESGSLFRSFNSSPSRPFNAVRGIYFYSQSAQRAQLRRTAVQSVIQRKEKDLCMKRTFESSCDHAVISGMTKCAAGEEVMLEAGQKPNRDEEVQKSNSLCMRGNLKSLS